MRGFSAARDRQYLEPYLSAHAALRDTLARLISALAALELVSAQSAARDALAANAFGSAPSRFPSSCGPHATTPCSSSAEKQLVDRYRSDDKAIQDAIVLREGRIDADAQAAIERIQVLGMAAVAVL